MIKEYIVLSDEGKFPEIQKGVHMEMSGKEVVNLIEKLKDKGMSNDEIIEIILYVENMNLKGIKPNGCYER